MQPVFVILKEIDKIFFTSNKNYFTISDNKRSILILLLDMDREKFYPLFDAMTQKTAFLETGSHKRVNWGSPIPGFLCIREEGGRVILSDTTKNRYPLQQRECTSRGNCHIVACNEQRTRLKDLYGDSCDLEMVVVVNSEEGELHLLTPVYKSRSDMMEWLLMIVEYCSSRQAQGNPVPKDWEDRMLGIARYFWENQEGKVMDASPYDRIYLDGPFDI